MRIGLVADDVTGAMDTGVQFVLGGMRAVILLDASEPPDVDAVAISTDSRALAPADAYDRAQSAALRLPDRLLFKKLDGTMRGNVGAEIDGMLDALAWERAVVAPSGPQAGRTVAGGIHHVFGVPLAESSFAQDPLSPMRESHLPTLLRGQTKRRVGHLGLETLESGVEATIACLDRIDAEMVVCDAVTVDHLHTLALALPRLCVHWLPCGAAGLAREWITAVAPEARWKPTPWVADPRPVLVVAGSRNPATHRQLMFCARDRTINLLSLRPDSPMGGGRVDRMAAGMMQMGGNLALTTLYSAHVPGAEQTTAEMLARVTARLLTRMPVAGLFLTGGDVARAVCGELDASGLRIVGEVEPGVPAAELVGGAYHGLRVVTKAGGLGTDEVISKSIRRLQGLAESKA